MAHGNTKNYSHSEQIAAKLFGVNLDENAFEKSQPKSRQPLYGFRVQKQDFYSPRQVADLMLFSPVTVWRWLREGRLPAVKIGRYYRIPYGTMVELISVGSPLRQNLINP